MPYKPLVTIMSINGLILSLKPLFHVQVGMVQPGFVKKMMAYGCFVEFPHGISGLAPLKFLTDEFISSPRGVYEEMQTVWAKVQWCSCVYHMSCVATCS